jgi:hypothetical protein
LPCVNRTGQGRVSGSRATRARGREGEIKNEYVLLPSGWRPPR